jgi:hypothetical protein
VVVAPPLLLPEIEAAEPALVEAEGVAEATPSEWREPIPEAPPRERVDEVVLSARSALARRGLGTRGSLLDRRALTHRLLMLWLQVRPYVEKPEERMTRQTAGELRRLVNQISEELEEFPPLLGEAGQPGYMLLTLAEMESSRDILKLDEAQRQLLRSHWEAGRKFLLAHRDFLRRELRALRQRSHRERLAWAVQIFLRDRPALAVLALLGLLALAIALWRTSG